MTGTESASASASHRRPRMGIAVVAVVAVVAMIVLTVTTSPLIRESADANTVSPQPVPLGAAAAFSLLGTSVNNNGTSSFEHFIGANPGAIVGFAPGKNIHADDQTAIDGLSALSTAYADAAGRTSTMPAISGDLNAVTLTPGVYNSAAAISTTGTVTLDGQGNPNAVFIIQINAALNMAADAQVALVNGTVATNVFWQVAGAVTLGANVTFSGVLLGNAAISLGANDTLAGAALTQSGAVSVDGGSVSTSPGFNGAGSAPQLIPLGSAVNFSLLGTSISNGGSTHTNLDIGANPGAITGFTSTDTSGTIHADDDAASSALDDLSTAYSTAATRSKTATIAGDLNGLTYAAGVYRAGAAISLTGTLTLDGKGDRTSVFLFQIPAAFTVAASARIVLINGANAGNVFWQTAGATTIGTSASFVGMILGNAAISIGAGATISGAALSQNGAVTLNSVALSTTPGYSGALSETVSGTEFGAAILSGTSVVLTSPAQTPWSIVDSRGSPTAWSMNVTATVATSAAGQIDSTARGFPTGSLMITPNTVTASSGDATTVHTAPITLSETPQRLAWSAGSAGKFSFSPLFSLTVPANAYRSNFSGALNSSTLNPYISTITVTIG